MSRPRINPQASAGAAAVLRVLDVTESGALLVAPLHRPAEPWRVRCALPAGTTAGAGDEVVVLDCGFESVAIARIAAPHASQLSLRDGTRVEVDADATQLWVRRADGREVFRYDVHSRDGAITIEAESLTLSATRGDLQLRAAGELQLSAQRVHACAQAPDAAATSLSLEPRRAKLQASCIDLEAEDMDIAAQRTQVVGREFRSALERAVLQVERLETKSDVVWQTARNLYTHVRELMQERAGSMRTLVDGTAQLRARDIAQRAEGAYKLRAEKIHLG